MAHNCSHETDDTPRGHQQGRALKAIAAIKGAMFVVKSISGYLAHSKSMIADSADMLEDTLGAAASLVVHNKGPRAQAGVALAKGAVMTVLGLGVLGSAAFTLFNPATLLPVAATMGIVGGLGMAANAACASLLYRFRNDNINMKAAWKCLRNDIISNAGVLVAAGLSRFFTSALPDLIIGASVATLCVKSGIEIAREAMPHLRAQEAPHAEHTHAHKPGRHRRPEPAMGPKIAAGFKKALRTVFGRAATPAPQAQSPLQAFKPSITKFAA